MTAASVAPHPVLQVEGLTKAFVGPTGPRPVLRGVDLSLTPGELVAVAGRSGSGKTTLLTIVAGWEQPDAGSVRLDGAATRRWSDLAVLPQSLGLLEELTVAENVAFPLRLIDRSGGADGVEALDLMRRLGTHHLADRFPAEVSLGEQQRVALARAMIVRPRLLLADEPVSHQNREWAEAVMAELRRLVAGGVTCLVATHNQVALEAADRVFELRDGRLRG